MSGPRAERFRSPPRPLDAAGRLDTTSAGGVVLRSSLRQSRRCYAGRAAQVEVFAAVSFAVVAQSH